MKPKLTFTIFSILMALAGISMLVFAKQITLRFWPEADPDALKIGITLRYLMGVTIFANAAFKMIFIPVQCYVCSTILYFRDEPFHKKIHKNATSDGMSERNEYLID